MTLNIVDICVSFGSWIQKLVLRWKDSQRLEMNEDVELALIIETNSGLVSFSHFETKIPKIIITIMDVMLKYIWTCGTAEATVVEGK